MDDWTHFRAGFLCLVTAVSVGSLSLPMDAHASCGAIRLSEEFQRASQVYLARLVLTEYVVGEPPPGLDAEAAQEQTPRSQYRFALRVDRVYKGAPGPRVEKSKFELVNVTSGSPLELERVLVGTQILMFEPEWDSGCSMSSVVDEQVAREILPKLDQLSTQSGQTPEE